MLFHVARLIYNDGQRINTHTNVEMIHTGDSCLVRNYEAVHLLSSVWRWDHCSDIYEALFSPWGSVQGSRYRRLAPGASAASSCSGYLQRAAREPAFSSAAPRQPYMHPVQTRQQRRGRVPRSARSFHVQRPCHFQLVAPGLVPLATVPRQQILVANLRKSTPRKQRFVQVIAVTVGRLG